MSNAEDLLQNQNQLSITFENIYSNFKKDSPERKTFDYIKRRLDVLDRHWNEYQENHNVLSTIEIIRSHSYFQNNEFELAQDRYKYIRGVISNYNQGKEERPKTPLLQPAKPLGVPSTSQAQFSKVLTDQEISSKTDEMIRRQVSYFKAFEHTITSIILDNVNEKWEFDHLLKSIQSRWSLIDSLHWELDSELGGRNTEYENTFLSYEQKYNDIIKSLNKKLWSISHREQSTPHIDIPVFSGNYHQWCSFKDVFKETIHQNPSLSSAQKMQFLKTKVRGEAERLIQHLPITSDNYLICWDILNNRYNNKSLIFRSHIDILLNIPVAQQTSLNHIKRIHDTTTETINAIKNLGVNVGSWDPLIIHLMSQKLDSETYNAYINTLKQPRELATLNEFLKFLENKFTSLESSKKKPEIKNSYQQFHKYNRNFNKQSFPTSNKFLSHQNRKQENINSQKLYKCELCKTNEHCLFYCNKFLNMTPPIRRCTVTRLGVCENCLYSHNGKQCFSEKRCNKCHGNHNTIIHEAYDISIPSSSKTANREYSKHESPQQVQSNSHVSLQRDTPEILLATAMLKVKAKDGSFIKMRALIDQGSQTSLITEHAAQILGQPRQQCRGVISGVGIKESNCKGVISITCASINNNFQFETEAYIMKNLINNLPNSTFSKPSWPYIDNITLADPDFNISRPVDLLLGADIYSLIVMEGICKSTNNVPIAQNTRLGWILIGNVKTLQCNVVINNLEEIQKFWEIEDIIEESQLSTEDQECINYYKTTTTRLEDGRYEVRLPMHNNFSEKLGESKYKAVAQLKSLEKRFIKHKNIHTKYKLFMEDYRSMGHMKPACNMSTLECFNTHHCVRTDSDVNSKFRVVFNASCKTSSGYSLNDLMKAGPNLQQDLQSLIIKWRQYQFAFTGDIEKMFRQIWLHPDDQKLLKIVWRDSNSEPIREYQLTTVTYGTKAAPYLAMMTLKQLASDERNNYPNSSAIEVLENSFYMDDVIHGCHSIEEAKQLQSDLIKLLQSSGFNLRKWKSNTTELLQNITEPNINSSDFNFKQSKHTKTLGLGWNPEEDIFTFQSQLEPLKSTKISKRMLLSDISKLFDPIGWLSPLSTKLKIIFQQVWAANIGWDDEIPEEIYKEWIKIRSDISVIKDIKLPRWIRTRKCDSIELHGFCDSSMKAYACVIYCRVNKGEDSHITLLIGKTRLVPTSKVVTLPRLELSGALLLSKLMNKVKICLMEHDIKTYGWIDSTVVLGWLNGNAARWKTFVANRVQQITKVMPPDCWRYIKSEENPADCASRGLSASQLKDHSLWWQGPKWLSTFADQSNKIKYSTDQELKVSKQVAVTVTNSHNSIILDILSKHSTFRKAVRIVAWICRFTNNKKKHESYLSVEELKQATLLIIRNIQQLSFEKEISELMSGNKIHRKSKLCELNPYVDQQQILRVGGRLRHANLDPDMKNPIIIPNNSRLTELLIDDAHQSTYHGGARLTSSYLRQKYWIMGGYRTVKKIVRRCIKCRKHNPSKHYQIMGDLPAARVNPSRPFYNVGVDYTGHVFIKSNTRRRNQKYNFATVATKILLFFMTLFTNTIASYTIAPLQNNSSLFFDDIAKMHLIADDWRLIVYYDMNPYWHGDMASRKYLAYLETICVKIKAHSQCEGVMYQLNHEYSELQHYNRLLLDQRLDGHARKRRGLINGVGYVANQLFGILDSNFAEKYEHDIDLIKLNQRHMVSLWKNQTSVVEAEFNLIKRVETVMQNHHKTVTKKLNEIDIAMGLLQSEMQNNTYISEFTMTALLVNNILIKLKSIQGYLLETITDIFNGKFNIHFLTPKQLQEELNIISSQLSKDLSLPTDRANPSSFYKLLKIKASLSQKFLLFEISIPLVTRDTYDLLKVIAIPKQFGKHMISIVPVSEYLALNMKKDSFIMLSDIELHVCENQDVETMLCRINKPIYHFTNERDLCKKAENFGSCLTVTNTCKDKLISINKPNKYFYFCCNSCQYKILCEQRLMAIQLNNSGILSIEHDCLIKSSEFYIQTYRRKENIIQTTLDMNTSLISPINNLINLSLTDLPVEESSNNIKSQITNVEEQIKNIKRVDPIIDSVSYHDIHHYTVIYLVMVTMLVIGGILFWRARRRAEGSPSQHQAQESTVRAGGSPLQQSSGSTARARGSPPQRQVLVKSDSESVKGKKCCDRSTSPTNTLSIFNV